MNKAMFTLSLVLSNCLIVNGLPIITNASIKDKEFVGQLYACMNITNKILAENNITYWACGGGLLGALRHGGFIPWDFDLDLEVTAEGFQKILDLKETFLQHNMYFGLYIKNVFLRIHHDYINANSEKKNVFIEFYETYASDNTVRLKFTKFCTLYKESYWYAKDLENIRMVPFGPIFLSIADNAKEYLIRYYGKDVLQKANGIHQDITVFSPAEYSWPIDADTTIYK